MLTLFWRETVFKLRVRKVNSQHGLEKLQLHEKSQPVYSGWKSQPASQGGL